MGTGVVPSAHGLNAPGGVSQLVVLTVGSVLGVVGAEDYGVRWQTCVSSRVTTETTAPAARYRPVATVVRRQRCTTHSSSVWAAAQSRVASHSVRRWLQGSSLQVYPPTHPRAPHMGHVS